MVITVRFNTPDFYEKWLQWAVELQSLEQAAIFYGKDAFDQERYERIREIAAERISYKTVTENDVMGKELPKYGGLK